MTPIHWTEPALADLRAIDVWLARETSADLARATLGRIRFRAVFLQNFPHGGRPMANHGCRVLRVLETPYLIIYRITPSGLEILRLRHEREDWQALD